MSRMGHRILMGMVVMPFVVLGWLYSVWLSEQSLAAAEHEPPSAIAVH